MITYYMMTLDSSVREMCDTESSGYYYVPFIWITAQIEVARWLAHQDGLLSKIKVTEYNVEQEEEMLSILTELTGDDCIDLDDYELTMIYDKNNRCAPVRPDSDGILMDYIIDEFFDDVHTTINHISIMIPYLRIFDFMKKYLKIIKTISGYLVANRRLNCLLNIHNEAILINYIEKEGISYYEIS